MKNTLFGILVLVTLLASFIGTAVPAVPAHAATFKVADGANSINKGSVSLEIPLPQTELIWDSDTVLLEKFNGSTSGEVFGGVEYVDSITNLDKALYLPQGSWIRYTPSGLSQLQNSGSIEFFIAPTAYNTPLLTLQWFNTNTPPGYVLGLTLQADGKIQYGVWNGQGDGSLTGTTPIPLDTWSHAAITWDGSGSKILINGRDRCLNINENVAFITELCLPWKLGNGKLFCLSG
jgi:hypothetical protein